VQIDPARTYTNQNKHHHEHRFNVNLWTTVPSYVAGEKTSTHPGIGSTTTARPFTDLENIANSTPTTRGRLIKRTEAWTTWKKEQNQKPAQAPLHERNMEQKHKTQTNEQHNNDDQPPQKI